MLALHHMMPGELTQISNLHTVSIAALWIIASKIYSQNNHATMTWVASDQSDGELTLLQCPYSTGITTCDC